VICPIAAVTYGIAVNERRDLLSKAEKRAAAGAARARAAQAARRRRMLLVAGAAVAALAVVAALVVVLVRSYSPATAPISAPATATPFPPLPPGADPALATKPQAKGGGGTLTSLVKTTLIEGKGPVTAAGQTITVNYVGVTYADGKEFDSSWSRSEAFSFTLGGGNVIKGWDQGLVGFKVGSRVQLDIPPALAYGDNPTNGAPKGALRFVVDVLGAQ
jgi:peptidylprolyl isomerase